MTLIAEHATNTEAYRMGWNEAADGAEYISNPYHGIRQEHEYAQWANGYIAFLDMICGEED